MFTHLLDIWEYGSIIKAFFPKLWTLPLNKQNKHGHISKISMSAQTPQRP